MTTAWTDAGRLAQCTAATGLPQEDAASREAWARFLQAREYRGRALHDKAASRVARRWAMPQAARGRLWLRLSGGEALLRADGAMYARALAGRLGLPLAEARARLQRPPAAHDPAAVPSFGSPTQVRRLCLTREGQDRLARVLLCLQYEHSEALFCPFLPTLVAACLHWMGEAEAFATATALLRQPSPFVETRLQTWLMLVAMDQVAARCNARAYRRLCAYLGLPFPPPLDHQHPLGGAVMLWVSHHLPFWALMRFLDNFVVEGEKTFYRFGLALLQCWKKACPHAHPDTAAPAKELPVPIIGISPAAHLNTPDAHDGGDGGSGSGSGVARRDRGKAPATLAAASTTTARTAAAALVPPLPAVSTTLPQPVGAPLMTAVPKSLVGAAARSGPGSTRAAAAAAVTGTSLTDTLAPPAPGRRSEGQTPTPDDPGNAPAPPAEGRKGSGVTFRLGSSAADEGGDSEDSGSEADELDVDALARGRSVSNGSSSSGGGGDGSSSGSSSGFGGNPFQRERSDSLVSYVSDTSDASDSEQPGSAGPPDPSLLRLARGKEGKDDLALQAMSSASLKAMEQMFLKQKKDDRADLAHTSAILEEAGGGGGVTSGYGGTGASGGGGAEVGGRRRSMSGGEVLLEKHHQEILSAQRATMEAHAKEYEDKPVRSPSMTVFEFNVRLWMGGRGWGGGKGLSSDYVMMSLAPGYTRVPVLQGAPARFLPTAIASRLFCSTLVHFSSLFPHLFSSPLPSPEHLHAGPHCQEHRLPGQAGGAGL